jgi:hypothetical protein
MNEFEVGQKWRTRSGEIATISRINREDDNDVYPISAQVTWPGDELPSDYSFAENGMYWYLQEIEKHDLDLIDLIEQNDELDESNSYTKKFVIGQKWRTRDGNIATVTGINPDTYYIAILIIDSEDYEFSVNINGEEWSNSESCNDLMELIVVKEKQPHKHAEVIKAWADGEKVQVKDFGVWYDDEYPSWLDDEYRVKPIKEYPTDILGSVEAKVIWITRREKNQDEDIGVTLVAIGDAAVKKYIDSLGDEV